MSSTARRLLPVLRQLHDIEYLDAVAQGVLNPPASTGMPFWSINPYVGCAFGCAYCYARYAHRYAMERHTDGAPDTSVPAWLAFERRILVKRSAPALLRRALERAQRDPAAAAAPLLRGAPLLIGSATDPYQPAERHFRITRGLLEVLASYSRLNLVIITKSPLVTRDIDLLARLTVRARVTVQLSLITIDRELARRIEPRAPTPEARLRAMRRLREAGIDVGVNCMPVLPGITDAPQALDALVAAVADTGVTHVAACALRLQPAARTRYLPVVREHFPALAPRYEATYRDSVYVGERYRAGLSAYMTALCARYGLATRRRSPSGHTLDDTPALDPSPVTQQLTLALA
ncbi:MAG: radical SAM protein [Gemmatimonadaceae bacterium]|jgi:DNA repair photolyase|nr:radical SAM protein [Gemmatimonadaceae bacterium]